jgi:hypothetical protein
MGQAWIVSHRTSRRQNYSMMIGEKGADMILRDAAASAPVAPSA